ncbi:MAG: hypothetical protein D6784_13655 [Chloroflexi bacterium]|nr:MAG: hypothetical protein D6784_13655 [Chloroflexota bacterium]
MNRPARWFLLALGLANVALLLSPGAWPRVAAALVWVGLLPGLAWMLPRRGLPRPADWILAAGLSYIAAMTATLLLFYLPGPLHTWQLLVALNGIALLPLAWPRRPALNETSPRRTALLPLLLVMALAVLLRVANLHYSEFQGDEALAMLSAAEALSGHENALFLRSKGPGEVLLPMAVWRLAGVVNEPTARLPFTLASLFAILTIYQIGVRLGGPRLGWLSAGFFAFNGLMVAFGRIVQYQSLVVWMSALAFWLALRWRETRQVRYAVLSGLCLGAGLLAHYDAVLVTPALGWLLLGDWLTGPRRGASLRQGILAGLAMLAGGLVVSLPFYLPFSLDPQAGRAGTYVGERIGSELRNNLPDFFHFTAFYSSGCYLLVSAGLVLVALAWCVTRGGRRYRWLAVPLLAAVVAVVAAADGFIASGVNLAGLPFGLLFLAAWGGLILARRENALTGTAGQAVVVWLAVPFWGYNFVVALGLTHIYTVAPAWALLSAAGWLVLVDMPLARVLGRAWPWLAAGLAAVSTVFLWAAFVRTDVEYVQDYPQSRLAGFWTPYPDLPRAGFFGFPHRAGWKAVGQLLSDGTLQGDYRSNEEPDVTTWYTRAAPRACDDTPEFYFLADDLVDRVEVPAEVIRARYREAGRVSLPNGKGLQILQLVPGDLRLNINEPALSRAFDRSAVPEAFARTFTPATGTQVNFGNLVRLVGYSLDLRRTYPGGRVPVTLYWQALAPIPREYHVFVHLETGSGPAAQADGAPVCWSYPTTLWRPGQILADPHAIPLPPDIQPGVYPLEIGLYTPDTWERLDVLDVAGNPAGVSFRLAEVEIGD